MSQSLVFALLALALVLPVLGAFILRILAPRLSEPQLYSAAALVFGIAIASVLLLAHANVTSIQVGDLSLLLPAAAPVDEGPTTDRTSDQLVAPPAADQQPTPGVLPTEVVPTTAPTAIPTAAPTIAPTTAPTVAPTDTLTAVPITTTVTPTTALTATPITTLEPATPAPPTAAPTPPARRTYVVRAGDTLRGIAQQFGVSVQALVDANHLTPAQADALRVGQELVIP